MNRRKKRKIANSFLPPANEFNSRKNWSFSSFFLIKMLTVDLRYIFYGGDTWQHHQIIIQSGLVFILFKGGLGWLFAWHHNRLKMYGKKAKIMSLSGCMCASTANHLTASSEWHQKTTINQMEIHKGITHMRHIHTNRRTRTTHWCIMSIARLLTNILFFVCSRVTTEMCG